jgi:hypothetical protein
MRVILQLWQGFLVILPLLVVVIHKFLYASPDLLSMDDIIQQGRAQLFDSHTPIQ